MEPLNEMKFQLFIDEDGLRLMVEDEETKATHKFKHTSPAAPGDCQLTEEQARAIYERLRAYFRGRRRIRR